MIFDCVGKELNIGDKVVCADGYYSDLLLGEVIDLTPKMILVEFVRSSQQDGEPMKGLKYPYQVYKMVGPKCALKESFITERYDNPTTEYRCAHCNCDDSIYEDDKFCRECGSKFIDETVTLGYIPYTDHSN